MEDLAVGDRVERNGDIETVVQLTDDTVTVVTTDDVVRVAREEYDGKNRCADPDYTPMEWRGVGVSDGIRRIDLPDGYRGGDD